MAWKIFGQICDFYANMTTEDKFRAAVNVIRSLPKNGSYQPSYDLMLRFYAYYKQATEGECKESQPAFWEVVKKKKWEAWTRLGKMSRHEAMENYVEQLKKIVETMSYTDNVANFLESLGSFYETVPQEDLHMLVGNIIERVGSREASPQRAEPVAVTNGTHSTESDSETDEFIDTVESNPDSESDSGTLPRPQLNGNLHNGNHNGDTEESWQGRARSRAKERGPAVVKSSLNGHAMPIPEDASSLAAQISLTSHKATTLDAQPAKITDWGHVNGGSSKDDVAEHLRATIKQLQRDLERVTSRVRSLEVAAQPSETRTPKTVAPSWWPLSEVSPRTAAFVVLWPFVAHLAIAWWRNRRSRH